MYSGKMLSIWKLEVIHVITFSIIFYYLVCAPIDF